MGALLFREPQRRSQRADHGGRRMRVTTLFEPNQVVDADAGERRDFFATKPRSTPPATCRQADFRRRYSLPPCS